MADAPNIDALYDSTLKPRLQALESLRRPLKGFIIRALVMAGVPFSLFFFQDLLLPYLPEPLVATIGVAGFVGAMVALVVAVIRWGLPGLTAYLNYRGRFKHEIVGEIFKVVCPTATYAADQGVTAQVFDAPGIFSTRGSFSSDDRVRGRIGRTPFEAAEVNRRYSTGGKNSTTHVVFHGLFFHADFNKTLRGATIVLPEKGGGSELGDHEGLKAVPLENPEFEREFKVFASNEVEARYVLTPAMMEQLLAIRRQSGKPIFLGFKGNSVYIGVHYGRSLFEPGIASTTSKDAIKEMAAHFAFAQLVIETLDLDTRIWTKDVVDDSMLRQPDREPAGPLDLGAIKAGALTEKDLWAKATAAVGSMIDADSSAEAPKPARTSIRVDSAGGTTTIRYGFSVMFFVLSLISISCAVLCWSALRALPRALELGAIGSMLAGLPTVAMADRIVGDNAIPWLVGAGFVGGVLSLGWVIRVRRVVIAPDAVRIYRGFRPFPRVYPRPLYSRVVRIEGAVYVGKNEGLNLINPTASPALAEEEAKWVAFEMHKALRQGTASQVLGS